MNSVTEKTMQTIQVIRPFSLKEMTLSTAFVVVLIAGLLAGLNAVIGYAVEEVDRRNAVTPATEQTLSELPECMKAQLRPVAARGDVVNMQQVVAARASCPTSRSPSAQVQAQALAR